MTPECEGAKKTCEGSTRPTGDPRQRRRSSVRPAPWAHRVREPSAHLRPWLGSGRGTLGRSRARGGAPPAGSEARRRAAEAERQLQREDRDRDAPRKHPGRVRNTDTPKAAPPQVQAWVPGARRKKAPRQVNAKVSTAPGSIGAMEASPRLGAPTPTSPRVWGCFASRLSGDTRGMARRRGVGAARAPHAMDPLRPRRDGKLRLGSAGAGKGSRDGGLMGERQIAGKGMGRGAPS